jgi:RNA polymerase sigma factor (sigma-70 family)
MSMDAASAALRLPLLSDEQLAASFIDGEAAFFEEIVRRYSGPIHAFIFRMVGRAEDADDLTQDVFVRILRSLPSARRDLPLRPWVYVIARNKCLDHLKRRRALTFSSLTDDATGEGPAARIEDAGPLPQELVERADLRDALQGAISTLPERYRLVVALRYSTDLTFAEIGAVLALPENTVKTHFQRAKALLRVALRDRI